MSTDNQKAIDQWKAFIAAKVEVIIKPTPKSFECKQPFVVVPKESPRFVIGEFDSVENATVFCKQNKLPVSA
ncbi:hypothetical protein RYA05_03375 [Pseudomonas syringae pv. actinidiae]|nr:hypothetical protein [Pseudomonas syringae pv. actinidiae]